MQIINTRPQQRAHALTQELIEADHEVLDLPLLALEALPLDENLQQQFIEFREVEYVVVVSPTAAEIGLQYYFELGLQQSDLQKKTWIAVGVATQQYLSQFEIISHVPEVETSEGMLALDLFKQFKNRSIAFWRGIGGRTFMMESLQQQGCNVLNMLLYQRKLPQLSLTRAELVKQDAIVIITSEESWNNWYLLSEKFNWDLLRFSYIVLADRVTQILQDYFLNQGQKPRITTVHSLKIKSILEQVNRISTDE